MERVRWGWDWSRIRFAASIAVLSLATLVMDGALLPGVEGGWPLSTACALEYAASFLAYACGAWFGRGRMDLMRQTAFSCGLCLVGAATWAWALGQGGWLPACFLANAVLSLGRAWSLCVVAMWAVDMAPTDIFVGTALGIMVSYLLYVPMRLLPGQGQAVASGFLPVVAMILCRPGDDGETAQQSRGDSLSDLSVTNPLSFVGLSSPLYLSIAVFETAFGLHISLGQSGAPGMLAACCVALLVVVVGCVMLARGPLIDAAFDVAACLLVTTTLFIDANEGPALVCEALASTVAAQVFRALTWVLLVSLASRNRVASFYPVAVGFGLSAVFAAVGASVGDALRSLPAGHAVPVVELLTLGVFCFLWYGMRHVSLDAIVQGVYQVNPPAETVKAEAAIGPAGSGATDAAPSLNPATPPEKGAWGEAAIASGTIISDKEATSGKEAITGEEATAGEEAAPDISEALISALAETARLTQREAEVFALLARGRNARYIEEGLGISRNTVKTHIRHIYEKTGVHTQQELIDLVEGRASVSR